MAGFFSRLLGSLTGKPAASPPPVAPRSAPRPPATPTAATPARAAAPPSMPSPARAATPAASAPRVKSEALSAFVASVESLPFFSGTALQILQSVGSDDITTDELGRLISADAGLAAGLLRMVNSSFYALPNKVSTVTEAISVLGLNQVRRTVLSAVSQRPVAEYLKDSKVVRAFWRHLLLTAAMSRHMATQNRLDGEVAYTAGLMHEVGRLAMLIHSPHLGNLLLHVQGDGDGLGIDRERAHFGFDHAHVGGALLEHWGLPEPIVQAAWDHGDDDRPVDALSAAVWRANLLAHDMLEDSGDDDVELPWMTAVGLSVEQRRKMLGEIAALEGAQH